MSARGLSCAEALGLADERHDRSLAPDEEAALRSHLRGCRACAAAAEASDRVHAALLGESAPPLPAAFTDQVVARLDRAPGSRAADGARPAPATWFRGAAALAGTGAVAALAILVLPLDAAAESVGTLVPAGASVPLPALPPEVAILVEGLPAVLPPWAAAAGAALSLAALAAILLRTRPAARTA